MDNLNFIKIYFKEFIYKIIVPKNFELSKKEIKKKKIIDWGWKHIYVQGSDKKTLERESKTLERESIWHFKSAKLTPFRLWPNSLGGMMRHTLFDPFVEGWVPIRVLHIGAIF